MVSSVKPKVHYASRAETYSKPAVDMCASMSMHVV